MGRPNPPAADVLPPGPSGVPTGVPITSTVPDTMPVTKTNAPDTLPPPRPVGPVTITWVNVRSDPDRDARILGVLDPATPVTILESDVGWHRVRSAALTGWVYAEGLTQP
jgi:SH3-like domain-containing protein